MVDSTTFYLKYRPQKISQLDIEDIREKLADIFSSGQIPHAFLFSGPKGLGKTSAARIVAKAINCLGKVQGFEPCNKCDVCKSISNNTALDLIEIDGASNRGIDDIRALKESIKLAPNRAAKKVYVIDEAHMLTMEAFNALLKTLEEPPSHAVFILCTTALEKLPATIISRCQHFKFRLPTANEIIRALKRIKKAEKLLIKDEVLEAISRRSENSFRDGVKILEMLAAVYGKRISLKQAQDFLGREGSLAKDLLPLLAKKETKKALLWLKDAVSKGADLKILTGSILEDLRKMLLKKYDVGEEDIEDYGFGVDEIKTLITLFDKAARQLKQAFLPQLPLELAIVDWSSENRFKAPAKRAGRQGSRLKADKNINLETILEKWQEVLAAVKADNHSIEALLKASRPIKLESRCDAIV